MGPSINVGEAMCGILITENLQIYNRTSIFPISEEYRRNPDIIAKMAAFDTTMKANLAQKYRFDKV